MRKGLFKWFDWHWSPEDTKIRSVVEILTFVVIVGICGFLYVRWNTIPIRNYEIRVEDLSNGEVYSDSSMFIDSVRRVYCCDIKCRIPMTTHDEFYDRDTDDIRMYFYPLYSNGSYSDFIKSSFLRDSLRNVKNSLGTRVDLEKIFDKYSITFDKNYNHYSGVDSLKNSLDSLRNIVKHTTNRHIVSPIIIYTKTNVSFPYFSGVKYSSSSKDDYSFYYTKMDGKEIINEALTVFRGYNNSSNTLNSHISSNLKRDIILEALNLNFYKPFRGATGMEAPPLLRLEDISQTYVKLKLNSSTIDSIVLNIDFVGVTEFSAMNPVPDEIGMSNIVFRDPVKIYKIRQNGLFFHARFRELENIQQIRTFTVTAIGSAFVFALVVFAIFAYYRIREKIKNRKKKYSFIINCLLGYLLYSFLYWTINYFIVDDPNYITNLLTILIFFTIILNADRVFRNYLLNLLHKVNNIRKKKETK